MQMVMDEHACAKPTYAQVAKVLGCSERHVAGLVAAGYLTKGGDLRRFVSEWVEYQVAKKSEARAAGRKPDA